MPRSIIAVVGGPADGYSIVRPPRDQVTFPLQGGDIRYTVRRLRTASGRPREVLAIADAPLAPRLSRPPQTGAGAVARGA